MLFLLPLGWKKFLKGCEPHCFLEYKSYYYPVAPYHQWTPSEKAPAMNQEGDRAGTLTLDFSASGTVRNKSPSFLSQPVCGVFSQQPEQIKTSFLSL